MNGVRDRVRWGCKTKAVDPQKIDREAETNKIANIECVLRVYSFDVFNRFDYFNSLLSIVSQFIYCFINLMIIFS